jgi:DNA-binding transcriptional LysR family regulator
VVGEFVPNQGLKGVLLRIHEFRAFVMVADSGRMDFAAKTLGYSQPAISYQIKCLERSFQAKLFDRVSDGVRLTRRGRMILPSIRAVLVILDDLKRVSANRGSLSGRTLPRPRQVAAAPAKRAV